MFASFLPWATIDLRFGSSQPLLVADSLGLVTIVLALLAGGCTGGYLWSSPRRGFLSASMIFGNLAWLFGLAMIGGFAEVNADLTHQGLSQSVSIAPGLVLVIITGALIALFAFALHRRDRRGA